MHFLTIVALPPGYPDDAESIEEGVGRMMAPYDEEARTTWVADEDEEGGGYWTNAESFWDWYSIGGRWTGRLDGYDPEQDPALKEPCFICNGTGTRDWSGTDATPEWIAECNGCNGCKGAGEKTQWPTQWPMRRGDWARLGDVRAKLEESPPYHLVAAEQHVCRQARNPDWNGVYGPEGNGYFVDTEDVPKLLAQLSDDCIVVVVDCHS